MVTVRAEVANLRRIEAESARLYRQLQAAVDKQVEQVGFLPDATTYGMIREKGNHADGDANNGITDKAVRPASNGSNASEKQSAFIARMAKRLNLSSSDLDNLSLETCRATVAELDRKQASRLIDNLFQLDGQPKRVRRPAPAPDKKQAD